jgi:hypothetical protein
MIIDGIKRQALIAGWDEKDFEYISISLLHGGYDEYNEEAAYYVMGVLND